MFFFCKQKTAYEMRISDWSSDVCSSDLFGVQVPVEEMVKGREEVDVEVIQTYVQETLDRLFADKEASVGPETMRMLEKHIMLNVVDQNWKEHLARMDYLRQGIHLRRYAQQQPKHESQPQASKLFSQQQSKVKR